MSTKTMLIAATLAILALPAQADETAEQIRSQGRAALESLQGDIGGVALELTAPAPAAAQPVEAAIRAQGRQAVTELAKSMSVSMTLNGYTEPAQVRVMVGHFELWFPVPAE